MSDPELIFTEEDEAVLLDTSQAAGEEGVHEFLALNDQQRLTTWAALCAQPNSTLARSWQTQFQTSSSDDVLRVLLEDSTVDSWADGCSDIINRAVPFVAVWFSGAESEQALKIRWRSLSSDQQQWAAFLDEQLEGGGALGEWGRTAGNATDVSGFTRG
jgi:hypothetical protein